MLSSGGGEPAINFREFASRRNGQFSNGGRWEGLAPISARFQKIFSIFYENMAILNKISCSIRNLAENFKSAETPRSPLRNHHVSECFVRKGHHCRPDRLARPHPPLFPVQSRSTHPSEEKHRKMGRRILLFLVTGNSRLTKHTKHILCVFLLSSAPVQD